MQPSKNYHQIFPHPDVDTTCGTLVVPIPFSKADRYIDKTMLSMSLSKLNSLIDLKLLIYRMPWNFCVVKMQFIKELYSTFCHGMSVEAVAKHFIFDFF